MALPKRIKIGGGYYKGYHCIVSADTGDYTTLITHTSGMAVNSITITPDNYGAGDKMKVEHFSDSLGVGKCLAILAEDIYNAGASSTFHIDLPAAELVDTGESVKFTYTNVAGVALNVYLIVELIGVKKTT